MLQRVSFLASVCVLLHIAVAQLFPTTGVELNHNGASLPLYPQLQPNQITSSNKLWCSSANTQSGIAKWVLPSGTTLPTTGGVLVGDGAQVMEVSTSNGTALGLSPANSGTDLSEGIYKCMIQDEQGNQHTLPVWLVESGTTPNVTVECVQNSVNPLTVALNVDLIGFAPTAVNCREQGVGPITTGQLSRECVSGTIGRIRFVYGPSLPSTVECDITNGPTQTGTVTATCTVSSSITVPSRPGTALRINFNNSPIQQNGLITPASGITSTQPLWCQSSSTSSTITWTLPDGTVLGSNSNPTNGAQVLTATGQLGLAPFPSTGVLPAGVYTCTVDGTNTLVMIGETTDFGAPEPVSTTCDLELYPLTLRQCSEFTGGLPTAVTCRNGAGSNLIVQSSSINMIRSTPMIRYRVCVSFQVTLTPDTYTCVFTNSQASRSVSCSTTIDSRFNRVTITRAVRDPQDPSKAIIQWTPSGNSGQFGGYVVTITGSDGSTRVINTGSMTQVTVSNLSASIDYNVVVFPTGTGGVLPGPASNITAITEGTHDKCNPAEGFSVDVTLQRLRNENEKHCECMDIDDTKGFMSQALNAALIKDGSLVQNCSDPILIVDGFSCGELKKAPKEGTPKREKTEKTPKKPKTPKGGKKDKSPKKARKPNRTKRTKKAKTTKTKSPGYNDLGVEIKVYGLILCNSCQPFQNSTDGNGKRSVDNWEPTRFVRRLEHARERRTKEKSPKKGQVVDEVPDLISVGGRTYNVTVKDRGRLGLFCGCNLVGPGTACDCPDIC